jgi:hypothetical protein
MSIIDPAVYKSESLAAQPILPHEIGAGKAQSTGELCQRLAPQTTVQAHCASIQDVSPAALVRMNLVFLATDNLHAEVAAAERCQQLGVPLIQASVCGELLVAQVRFWSHADPGGPCVLCGFGSEEFRQLDQETVYSCQGAAHGDVDRGGARVAATRSFSFLCSMAADLALVQGLRHWVSVGQPVANTMVEYCGFTHRTVTSPLTRRAACPGPHERWLRREPPRCLHGCTPRELIEAAMGAGPDWRGVSLAIDRHYFASHGVCTSCGRPSTVGRFSSMLRAVGQCPDCGGQLVATPFHSHRPMPADGLGQAMDRPLSELVQGAAQSVVVRGRNLSVLFCDPCEGVETL